MLQDKMAEYEQKLDDIGKKITLGCQQEWVNGIGEEPENAIVSNCLEDLTDEAGYGRINVYSSEVLQSADEAARDALHSMKTLFGHTSLDFDYLHAFKYLYLGKIDLKRKRRYFAGILHDGPFQGSSCHKEFSKVPDGLPKQYSASVQACCLAELYSFLRKA